MVGITLSGFEPGQILPVMTAPNSGVDHSRSKKVFEPDGVISAPLNFFNPAEVKPVLIDFREPGAMPTEQLLEELKNNPAKIQNTPQANDFDFIARALAALENLDDQLALVGYVGYDAAVKLTENAPQYTYFVADDIARRLITEHDPHLIAFAKDTVAVELIIKDYKLLAFAEAELAAYINQVAPQLLDKALEYLKANKQELAYVNKLVALKMITLPPAQTSIAEYLPHISENIALKVCQRNPLLIYYVNENLLEKPDFVLAVLEAYQVKPQYYTDDNGRQERNDLLPHLWVVNKRRVKNGQAANPLLSDHDFLRKCEQLGDTLAPMILRKLDSKQ
jgi:hypothetical protein